MLNMDFVLGCYYCCCEDYIITIKTSNITIFNNNNTEINHFQTSWKLLKNCLMPSYTPSTKIHMDSFSGCYCCCLCCCCSFVRIIIIKNKTILLLLILLLLILVVVVVVVIVVVAVVVVIVVVVVVVVILLLYK